MPWSHSISAANSPAAKKADMLSGPLLITRFRNGRAYPLKLRADQGDRKTAEELIRIFKEAENLRRFELEEKIKGLDSGYSNPKIVQGLAKILMDRCEFAHSGAADPTETRKLVFSASAKYWSTVKDEGSAPETHRSAIFDSLEFDDSQTSGNIELWLFGDIVSNQRLVAFDPILPDGLIHRYNVAQVQGLLLHAVSLEIRIGKCGESGFRQMMQMMKFFRLMYSIADRRHSQLTLRIDGPGSILENARSYGLEIAQLFPAILLLRESWELTAELKMSGRSGIFNLELSDRDSYRTHYVEKGVWANGKVQKLIDRINHKYGDRLTASIASDIVPLGRNRYLLPDMTLCKANSDVAYRLEWIRYLSPTKIKFLSEIKGELPQNYLIAVKRKGAKTEWLSDALGKRLLVFSGDLTAPAIKKAVDALE